MGHHVAHDEGGAVVGNGFGAIASGKVTVPQYTWKVVVVLDRPGAPVTADTRVIAVRMPNSDQVANTDWRDYRVSVDVIEAATGYDFLSTVSRQVQAQIESQIDNQ